jgi:hypothetical protein
VLEALNFCAVCFGVLNTPNAGTPYCNRYSNVADTSTDLAEPAGSWRPCELGNQHVDGGPRTGRLELAVKGSQVQILSARQRTAAQRRVDREVARLCALLKSGQRVAAAVLSLPA